MDLVHVKLTESVLRFTSHRRKILGGPSTPNEKTPCATLIMSCCAKCELFQVSCLTNPRHAILARCREGAFQPALAVRGSLLKLTSKCVMSKCEGLL